MTAPARSTPCARGPVVRTAEGRLALFAPDVDDPVRNTTLLAHRDRQPAVRRARSEVLRPGSLTWPSSVHGPKTAQVPACQVHRKVDKASPMA
jgi:hypothetical protein